MRTRLLAKPQDRDLILGRKNKARTILANITPNDPRLYPDEVKNKILSADLNRTFQEEQRRYLKEQEMRQKAELEELKRRTIIDLEGLRQEHQTVLQSANIYPPDEFVMITDPKGTKMLMTDQQKNKYLTRESEDVAALQANIDAIEVSRLEAIKELAKLRNTGRPEDRDEIESLNQDLKGYTEQSNAAINKKLAIEEVNQAQNIDLLRTLVDQPGSTEYKSRLAQALNIGNKLDIGKLTFDQIIDQTRRLSPAHDKLVDEIEKRAASLRPQQKSKIGKPSAQDSRFNNIVIGKKKSGAGLNKGHDGSTVHSHILYNDQIDEYLRPILGKLGFIGVFMADEFLPSPMLQPNTVQIRGSFIMNIQPEIDPKTGKHNPGEHWTAIYWDLRHKHEGDYRVFFEHPKTYQGLYYYDPFGREPSDAVLRNLKILMDRIKKKYRINYEIFFSYNECQQQDLRSFECGFFSMHWLIEMYNGFDPQANCCPHAGKTTHTAVRPAEKEIKEFEKKVYVSLSAGSGKASAD